MREVKKKRKHKEQGTFIPCGVLEVRGKCNSFPAKLFTNEKWK